MHDLVIHGALVIDGSGRPAIRQDVAVDAGRISAIGAHVHRDARQVIDAAGLTLTPGFIDMHSHADFTLPAFPAARNSITQGVTTEVVGNCGWSPAPLSSDPRRADEMRAVSGGIGPALAWDWTGFDQYLDALEAARPIVNVVPLVGHSAIRVATMGMEPGAPSADQLDSMVALLKDALDAGAWGLSTGLAYPPSAFAAQAEIDALARVVAAHNALYATHVRDETRHALEAVQEAIGTAERSRSRVQISHLKAAGPAGRTTVGESLAAIATARERGARITCDVYPYEAMSTFLSQAVPPWALEGGMDALVGRLAHERTRQRIVHDMRTGVTGWPNLVGSVGGLDKVLITHTASDQLAWARGRHLVDLAHERGLDPIDLTLDLLQADRGATVMVLFGLEIEAVHDVIRSPFAVVGSDQLGVISDDAPVHPRAYGTFARAAGPLVRRGVVALEDIVHRMSGRSAAILGLADRGTVRLGAVADLVLMDASAFVDRATYQQPTRTATGIEWVLVGGTVVVERGVVTGVRAGHVLRRGSVSGTPTHHRC